MLILLRLLLILLITGFSGLSFGQVLGPSAQEVSFRYTSEFLTDDNASDAESLAQDHSQYIFGVFHSISMIQKFGLNADLVGGIGSPKSEMSIKILNFQEAADKKTLVKYQAWGKLLLHKSVAKKILAAGTLEIPMPADLSMIYDERCTDEHYNSFGDYWYFWDPLTLERCQYLSKPPHSNTVQIAVSPAPTVNADVTPRLDLLRGDNGNGKLFSIYVIHGFAESSTQSGDEGRINFKELNDHLKETGYNETIERKTQNRPLYIYTKTLTLADGKEIDVEIKHLLVETGIESRSVTFAKFFKDAVENADVIVYGGHSGLGGNLDIPSLESKAGKFKFNQKKRQIFFFDSCASYSYYLGQFSAEKTKSKIDVITNGLSSLFNTSEGVLEGLLDSVLTEKSVDLRWLDVLKAMEAPLDGGSFLLNVGGV